MKEHKIEDQRLILLDVATTWVSVLEPQQFDKNSTPAYSVVTAFDVKDKNYKKIVEAIKAVTKGSSPTAVASYLRGKIKEVSPNDIEHNSSLSEGMKKITFKNNSQPEIYDSTSKGVVRDQELSISGGDIVNLSVVIKLITGGGRTNIGSYVQRIGLVEKSSRSKSFSGDVDEWLDANGGLVDEKKEEVNDEEQAFFA